MLRQYFFIISFLSLTFFVSPAYSANDCDCETITCGQCEVEVDIKFYTLKCDNGNRVKSCKKPVCQAIEKKDCKLPTQAESTQPAPPVAEKKEEMEEVNNQVGVMVVAQGTGLVVRAGKNLQAKIGLKVFEKDYIETGADGKIKIKFKDENLVNITPNSKVTIEEMNFDLVKGTKKTMLNLIYGKVRSTVKQSYNGENYYHVKTPTAVAGVRGTDFITSFFADDAEEKVETRVQTFEGAVELSDVNKKQKVQVSGGNYASFVIDKAKASVFSEKDISQFVERGYLTPVYKLTADELKKLEITTNFNQLDEDPNRAIASNSDSQGQKICGNPAGDFNQCLWTCEGNPNGEKKCRTDLPNVSCVRKRCNANGKWAEDTRLPASFHGLCEPQKPVVKSCDY